MFLAHSFRLRDPWQREHTAEGATRWSRVFHRPTGLESDDALWLVCSGLPAGALVSINNHRLTPPDHAGPNQFDVTAHLAGANRIEILLPSDSAPQASSLKPSPTTSASASSATRNSLAACGLAAHWRTTSIARPRGRPIFRPVKPPEIVVHF